MPKACLQHILWYALDMHPDHVGKKVYVNLSAALLQQVDELAKYDYLTRSAFIRIAVADYVRQPGNAAKLNAKPGEDVELEQLIEEYKKEHPEGEI